jgi:hypothetical protein
MEASMELNELLASERLSFFAGGLMLLVCWAMEWAITRKVSMTTTKTKTESLAMKILRAAVSLSEGGGMDFFSANDLVIRAWELHPSDFSLTPYPHPDCNRVLSACMGKRGLVSMGLLRLVSPKVYAVTQAGLDRVSSEPAPGTQPTVGLARGHLRFLLHMEGSVAVSKRARRERVFLVDALEFWRIDGAATVEQIVERLAEVKDTFRAIESILPDTSDEAKRVRVVRHVHEDLLESFESSLGLRQARKPKYADKRQYHYA